MSTLTPVGQVLLSIDKVMQDELITDSGIKFFYDPSFKKEWSVAVTAKIAALPSNPNPKHKAILDQLKVGDEVVMSYQVVASLDFSSDRDRFMEATEENPHTKEFYNGKGESIRMYALPVRSGIAKAMWCAMYLNRRHDLIDGVQGSESEVARWMAQFKFGKTDEYTFNNFFEFGGKDYWKCDATQIFAKKVKGHLVAVGNRVICRPIDEEIKNDMLIDSAGVKERVRIRRQDRAIVLTGGKSKGLKKEDKIHFDPRMVEKYEIYNKSYFLINERLVLGKWN